MCSCIEFQKAHLSVRTNRIGRVYFRRVVVIGMLFFIKQVFGRNNRNNMLLSVVCKLCFAYSASNVWPFIGLQQIYDLKL